MNILDNILRLLKLQNKKQIDLTNYLGLSKNVFTEWKRGRNDSYIKHLPKIAEFLGVSVDYLLNKGNSESQNEFTYALQDEIVKGLSENELLQVKDFANYLRSIRNKQNG